AVRQCQIPVPQWPDDACGSLLLGASPVRIDTTSPCRHRALLCSRWGSGVLGVPAGGARTTPGAAATTYSTGAVLGRLYVLFGALLPTGLCGRGIGRGRVLPTAGTTAGATSTPVAAAPSAGPLVVPVSAPLAAWSAGVADVLDLFGLQTRVLPTFVLGQLALGALGDVECAEQVCGGGVGLLRLGHLQVECGV